MARVTWTMKEAANKWKVSRAQVQKWRDQKRIAAEQHGATWLITDDQRPKPAKRDTLTPAQRRVWQGKPRRTASPKTTRPRKVKLPSKVSPKVAAGKARAKMAKRDARGRMVKAG
jgi:hypothetical protein